MRAAILLLLTIFSAVLGSELQFVSLPQSVRLTTTSVASGLRTSHLQGLNANLLGLTTKPVPGFEVNSDLFERPMAIAIVLVKGVDSLKNMGSKNAYPLENDGFDRTAFDEELARSFGSDRKTVTVTSKGISGSMIALNASEQEFDDNIKTKLPVLREELLHIYRLAAAILVRDAEFEEQNAPDVYYITISGLLPSKVTEDRETGIDDIRKAIQVATDASETDINLKTWRELLNVYVFVGTDYPAIFAIFAGLTVTLALAVVYTVVGMMSMDPSKDSIIYRMTTTRMKKA
uniref:Renin receptor n=1 Tax=Angiostrongylus cantonensis TaxID=6313 RepID=A0A158P7W7_ANGCA